MRRLSVLRPGLSIALDRFPDRRDAIVQLDRKNETFQTLCNDYRKCELALRYWIQSEKDGAEYRREEYEILQRELEGEILRYLDEFEKRTRRLDQD
jgi:hypothetical protein